MSSTNPSVNGHLNIANDYNIGYTNSSMDNYRTGPGHDNIMPNPHQVNIIINKNVCMSQVIEYKFS